MRRHYVEPRKQDDDNKTVFMSLQLLTVNRRNLRMIGVDRRGLTICAKVEGFQPTFLLQRPDCDFDLEEWVEEVNDNLMAGKPHMVEPIASIDTVKMTQFIGFTNRRKDDMLRVVCSNIQSFKLLVSYFESEGESLYHHDFDFRNQFLQQTGLTYQSWVILRQTQLSAGKHHDFSCVVDMDQIREANHKTDIPPILKCFVRIKAVSRDGALEGKPFKADPTKIADRLVAIAITFVWGHKENSKPIATFLATTFPKAGVTCDDTVGIFRCNSERDIVRRFRSAIVQYDPDDIFYYPDHLNTLLYIARRAELNKVPLTMSRFSENKWRIFERGGRIAGIRVPTRSLINVQAALKKKVTVSLESYDLVTTSCHPGLRQTPECESTFHGDPYDINRLIQNGVTGRTTILNSVLRELYLIAALEHDCAIRMEFANISKVSDTPLTGTVSRGEQIRVWNKLSHFCIDENFYVNRTKLAQKPLRFSIKTRPPTFPDPPEQPEALALRAMCNSELKAKHAHYAHKRQTTKRPRKTYSDTQNFFGAHESGGCKDADVAVVEGGNVLVPSPRYWKTTRIGIYDFKSLYPSIMRAFNISYENLVFDEEYLDIEGVNYLFVPINPFETVAIADIPGIIPKLLKLLVDARGMIKKLMKVEQNPFKKKSLDKAQNSMKVLCNATYGFCGASGKGALLPIRVILYVVTALGRYLQKETSRYLEAAYGVVTIYGDTDSVFVYVKHDASLEDDMDALVADLAKRYSMPASYTWDSVCAQFSHLDMSSQPVTNQVNAALFVVHEKLCLEVSERFRTEIILEFENQADNVWMGWVKKCYTYRFWDPSDPTKVKKIKVTGMPSKKREYTPWTRNCLVTVTDMILYDRTKEIQPFLTEQLNNLVEGQVPIDQLQVSREFKDATKYKHFRQPHLQVVLKRQKRHRWPVPSKSRVYFVIVKGKEKQFMRSETPEYAAKHKLKLDIQYYLSKQFYRPMKKLLTYHPELFDFEEFYAKFSRKLFIKSNDIAVLSTTSSSGGVKGVNKMSLAQAIAKRRNDARPMSVVAQKSSKPDPFAMFAK